MTNKFIKNHRKEIDACINKHCPGVFGRLNDNVRWDWIINTQPSDKCYEKVACNKVCINKSKHNKVRIGK